MDLAQLEALFLLIAAKESKMRELDLLDTDLSSSEMLSLAAAVIASPSPLRFSQLSLAPRAGQQVLRQLKPGQILPLWPPS